MWLRQRLHLLGRWGDDCTSSLGATLARLPSTLGLSLACLRGCPAVAARTAGVAASAGRSPPFLGVLGAHLLQELQRCTAQRHFIRVTPLQQLALASFLLCSVPRLLVLGEHGRVDLKRFMFRAAEEAAVVS